MRDPKLPDPNLADPNYSPYGRGNMYQQEAERIIRRLHADLDALFAKARESGHFPDDPGHSDEYGDPINCQLDRARIAHERARSALSNIYPELRVEALADEYVSF